MTTKMVKVLVLKILACRPMFWEEGGRVGEITCKWLREARGWGLPER